MNIFFSSGSDEPLPQSPTMRRKSAAANPDSTDPQFLIDDSLPPLVQVETYLKSHIVLQKLYLARSIADFMRQVTLSQCKKTLVPAIEILIRDSEPTLRQALVENIPEVCMYFIEQDLEDSNSEEKPYNVILHILVPLVAELTTDRNDQVRSRACTSLIAISGLVHRSDVLPYIVPIIKSLANDSTEENHRAQAAQLIAEICPMLPLDDVEKVTLSLLKKLARDEQFVVRKSVAQNIGKVSHVLGFQKTTESLLPLFVKLTQDETWGVRKASVESITEIGRSLKDYNERYHHLMPIFEKLLVDQSRWVKAASYENLGRFISILSSEQITPKLINYFNQMVTNLDPHLDFALECAFNFPAVALTIGASRFSEVEKTFNALIKSEEIKVRKTLSYSLHEIANVLKTEKTEKYLIDAFNRFLKDTEEVKYGILSHLGLFLKILSPGVQKKYLNTLVEIHSDKKWRTRELLSKELDTICTIFDDDDTNTVIIPLVLDLCLDPVAVVRKAAVSSMGVLVHRLRTKSAPILRKIEKQFDFLANHDSFTNRQLFIHLSHKLIEKIDLDYFNERFLPSLLKLAQDPIPNVRLVLAQFLCPLSSQPLYSHHQSVQDTLKKLKSDTDRDVVYNASHTKLHFALYLNPSYERLMKLQKEKNNGFDNNNNNNNNSNNNSNSHSNNPNNNNNLNEDDELSSLSPLKPSSSQLNLDLSTLTPISGTTTNHETPENSFSDTAPLSHPMIGINPKKNPDFEQPPQLTETVEKNPQLENEILNEERFPEPDDSEQKIDEENPDLIE